MPPDKPKYLKKIKLEKNVLRFFEKQKKTKEKSNKFHVFAIDGQFFDNFHHISTVLLTQ
jgi:hypothetical protein